MKIRELSVSLLNNLLYEIEENIIENIGFEEIAQGKHLLLIKSAKDNVCYEFLQKLSRYQNNMIISVIGEIENKGVLRQLGIKETNIYNHTGRFLEADVDQYISLLPMCEIDEVCFLNYQLFSKRYENIENICAKIAQKGPIKVFCYSTDDETVNKYVNIEKYVEIKKVSYALIEWLQYLISGDRQ